MENSEIPRDKKALRYRARALYAQVDFEMSSERVVDRLTALPEFIAARHVLLYLAMPHEINVEALLLDHNHCLAKAWYAPCCAPDRRLTIRLYDPTTTEMRTGPFGIREPDLSGAPGFEPHHIDLVLVPGLFFTPEGHRLGHGGGYYDRFLPSLPETCVKVGVISDAQTIDALPQDSWDATVDIVVTETRTFRRSSHL